MNVYNGTILADTQVLANYSPFYCNGTFYNSSLGTYNAEFSSGDRFTITVVEGNKMFLLLYMAIALVFVILILAIAYQNEVFAALAGFGMLGLALFIELNGISIFDNLVTLVIRWLLIGVGAYSIATASEAYFNK